VATLSQRCATYWPRAERRSSRNRPQRATAAPEEDACSSHAANMLRPAQHHLDDRS